MNIIKNTLPYFLGILPQFCFQNYTVIVFITILIGFLGGYLIKSSKVFIKIAVFQFFAFIIFYIICKENIAYLNDVFENLNLPVLLLPVLFTVFNVLNISILFFFGFRLQKLIVK